MGLSKTVPLINVIALAVCWVIGLSMFLVNGVSRMVIMQFILGLINIPFIVIHKKNLNWIWGNKV